MTTLRLGTRGSALARWQSDFVAAQLANIAPRCHIEIVEIVSHGDRLVDQPLSDVEGTGFFTATLERALLAGEIDVAVHSYKDLPVESADGLIVAAVPVRAAVEDVLCARDGLTLDALPAGARVGTCSARRTAQLAALRRDLDFRPLRGNVPTRLARVATGDLDAIVLARAGLDRLGLGAEITEVFALDRVLPAPAQGALAIQCRTGDTGRIRLLARLDDAASHRAVTAERTMLHALGGGCAVPVGAIAEVGEPEMTLVAGVFTADAPASIRVSIRGVEPRTLGENAARELLRRGADTILDIFNRTARLDVPVMSGRAS